MALLQLTAVLALLPFAWAVSDGPYGPAPPFTTACATMRPIHDFEIPQTSASPVDVAVPSTYTPGSPIFVALTVRAIMGFQGFMIQARPDNDANGSPVGTFIVDAADANMQAIQCVAESDTAGHKNADLTVSVSLQWQPPSTAQDVKFYYTIVQDFDTFWVMQSSDTVAVADGNTGGGDPGAGTGGGGGGSGDESDDNDLIKAHGSIMIIAWGVVAPVGMLLALFYKVIWPNGEWFYAHIVVMSTVLLLTIIGLILIIIHAEGKWLDTTEVNLPHQILAIFACVAVGVNPLLAIIRCDPHSEWRWVYNWAHGSIGLVLGQGSALAAMLLGLNIFRELASDKNCVHYAIYTMSAMVGLILMVAALYNIYAISFHKTSPVLSSTSEVPSTFPGTGGGQTYGGIDEDDELEPSRDYPLRAGLGVVFIVVQLGLAIATIALIAIA